MLNVALIKPPVPQAALNVSANNGTGFMILNNVFSTAIPMTILTATLVTVLLGGLAGCSSGRVAPNVDTSHSADDLNICRSAMHQSLPNGVLRASGEGASPEEALRTALANIAVQMQISIQSSSESQQRKVGNSSQQQFTRSIRSSSQQVFSDFKILCQSEHQVVVSFDNRPLAQRILSRLENSFSSGWQLQSPSWLRNSPALKNISDITGGETVTLKLFKLNKFWYLSLNDQQLKLRKNEWRFLYALPPATYQDHDQSSRYEVWLGNEFGLRLPATLKTGDEFRVHISSNITHKYFSLIYIQSDGSVYPARLNQPLNHHQIPSAPGIFSAEAESEISIDDYIVMLSNHAITVPISKQELTSWMDMAEESVSLGLRVYVQR
jgi:hypothetical protein